MQSTKTGLEIDRRSALVLGAAGLATLFAGDLSAQAQEGAEVTLAPGVTIKTLKEVKSMIPGFSKAFLHEITFQPGSSAGPEKLKSVNLCQILEAPLDINIEGQAPYTLQPGDIYVCPVGWVETDTNSGDKASIMRIFELIPA